MRSYRQTRFGSSGITNLAGRARGQLLWTYGLLAVAGVIVVGALQSDVAVPPWILIVIVLYGSFEAIRAVHAASMPCLVQATPSGLRHACARPIPLRPWARHHDETIPWEDIIEVRSEWSESISSDAPKVSELDIIIETHDGPVYVEMSAYDTTAEVLRNRIVEALETHVAAASDSVP
ncbi:MAG: hypothetical protein AAF721_00645 [Myxococcota bacterium]